MFRYWTEDTPEARDFSTLLVGLLSEATQGAADPNELLRIASGIRAGNRDDWTRSFLNMGTSVLSLAEAAVRDDESPMRSATRSRSRCPRPSSPAARARAARFLVMRDIRERKSAEAQLHQMAHYDAVTLKIDRAFVGDIASDPGDAAIVQAIIAMARKLGISTLAEGVETTEQRRMLRHFGIDMLQGFLVSQPLPASDIPGFLTTHARTTPFSRPAALPLTREPRPPRRAS